MNNKCTIALSLFAGILGGALSRYIGPASVLAQNSSTKEIRAQSVTLVDAMDQTVGTFMVAPDPIWQSSNGGGTRIVLRDSKGREIWSAGGGLLRPVTRR
jgi:hypothetical protein